MSVIKVFAPKKQEFKVAQVRAEDLEEIARWAGGMVREDLEITRSYNPTGHSQYLDVPVNYRLVRANIGDYILSDENSDLTVLPATLFEKFFEEV